MGAPPTPTPGRAVETDRLLDSVRAAGNRDATWLGLVCLYRQRAARAVRGKVCFRTLLTRERQILAQYTQSLAALIAEETRQPPTTPPPQSSQTRSWACPGRYSIASAEESLPEPTLPPRTRRPLPGRARAHTARARTRKRRAQTALSTPAQGKVSTTGSAPTDNTALACASARERPWDVAQRGRSAVVQP
jgi:ribosomal protein L32